MLLWRKFEDKLAGIIHTTKLEVFFTLYNGQEAVLASMHAMDLTKIK
jgi:TPP-dependent pyruvate/acetoin dehydrogenase alpha subunit